ncbi:MAG: hypothetical protein NVS1B3_08230 [Candidatus Dormibacteraceae bacterium]
MANATCPGANSQINTDQAMEALKTAQTAWSVEQALQTFLDQFKIKVVVLPFLGPSTISWDNLTDDDLPTLIPYGRLLICEYAKYSARWVDSSQIRRIALVKNLRTPLSAGTCMTNAVTEFKSLTVYHSVECTSPWGVRVQKHGLHHEFWHLMAFSVYWLHDSARVALNDPTFTYGKGSWDPVKGWGADARAFHPRAGFVSAYSTFAEPEDQAETYASMFVQEDYTELRDWMVSDAILKSKVEYMRKFIASIDPTMNLPYLSGQ